MQFHAQAGDLSTVAADLVAVVGWQQTENGTSRAVLQRQDSGLELDRRLDRRLSTLITREEFSGELGSVRLIETGGVIPARYVALLGGGDLKKATLQTWRRLGAALARAAEQVKAKSAAGIVQSERVHGLETPARVRALVEGMQLAQYRFTAFRAATDRKPPTYQTFIGLCVGARATVEKAAALGLLVAEATCQARDWINTPSNICTPQFLVDRAREVAKAGELTCTILDRKALEKERMGLFLAVAQASQRPPFLIHLRYQPSGRAKLHVALVGKGVTFDSGGYDIKAARHMADMKNDMGGAACVLATMRIMAALRPKLTIDAYIPTTENLIDAAGYKSSDILTARSGKTIEIVNTDAEGRLLLADTLDYALEQKPNLIIDLATLTGGVQYAVGELYTALLGNDQRAIDQFLAASRTAGDPMWQLPLEEEYLAGFKGGPAELRNCGKSAASTITGALFLAQFVGTTPWIHLDIAESSWIEDDRPLCPKGGTGAPTRTVCEFLLGL